MSLATWGLAPEDGGIVLPLLDGLDLDRTSGHYVEQILSSRGALVPSRAPECPLPDEPPDDETSVALLKPAWDPGIEVGWSSAGRWAIRLHGHEGERSGTYMLGFSEPPGLRHES